MFLRETGSIRNRIAIENDDGRFMTFGDLDKLSREYLTLVPSRSLAFILCDYNIDTVAFYYCMMTNHVVPLLLDKSLDSRLLSGLIEQYQPRYIWGPENRKEELGTVKDLKRTQTHVLVETSYEAPQMNDDLALLLTTSGSTGSPKLVRVSYKNIRACALATAYVSYMQPSDKFVTTMPMNYSYGLGYLHILWMAGGSVHVTEKTMIMSGFWEGMQKFQVTAMIAIPFGLEIMDRVGFLEMDLPAMRYLGFGGGSPSLSLVDKFARSLSKKKVIFHYGYGQTEVMGHFSACPAAVSSGEKKGTVGIPSPGFFMSLTDDSELILRGVCVCLGYAVCREDLSKGDENGGVLHTGDVASIDEDGYLYIRGRLKRFIKILGARTSLDEVESILGGEYPKNTIVCSGKDDDLRIFYTGTLDERQLHIFCKNKMGFHSSMVTVRHIDEIPRNASGKVMYQELEKYEREDR